MALNISQFNEESTALISRNDGLKTNDTRSYLPLGKAECVWTFQISVESLVHFLKAFLKCEMCNKKFLSNTPIQIKII
jgi:hypothetical protein